MGTPEHDEILMTYGECALAAGCGEKSIQRLAASGRLRVVRINARVVRVARSEWLRFCRGDEDLSATGPK
jgi:hypothetical protein